MITMLFSRVISEEEAEKVTGLRYIEYPDLVFETLTRKIDLNKDEYFKMLVSEIDECDIPIDNVIKVRLNGRCATFKEVSTGTKVLWLLKNYPQMYLYPTQWLGQNCYKYLFEIAKVNDIIMYEDSNMFVHDEADYLDGEFKDYHTGKIININNRQGWIYVRDNHY